MKRKPRSHRRSGTVGTWIFRGVMLALHIIDRFYDHFDG